MKMRGSCSRATAATTLRRRRAAAIGTIRSRRRARGRKAAAEVRQGARRGSRWKGLRSTASRSHTGAPATGRRSSCFTARRRTAGCGEPSSTSWPTGSRSSHGTSPAPVARRTRRRISGSPSTPTRWRRSSPRSASVPRTSPGSRGAGSWRRSSIDRHPAAVASLILADTYAGWKGSLSKAECARRVVAVLEQTSVPEEDFAATLPGLFGDHPPAGVVAELDVDHGRRAGGQRAEHLAGAGRRRPARAPAADRGPDPADLGRVRRPLAAARRRPAAREHPGRPSGGHPGRRAREQHGAAGCLQPGDPRILREVGARPSSGRGGRDRRRRPSSAPRMGRRSRRRSPRRRRRADRRRRVRRPPRAPPLASARSRRRWSRRW